MRSAFASRGKADLELAGWHTNNFELSNAQVSDTFHDINYTMASKMVLQGMLLVTSCSWPRPKNFAYPHLVPSFWGDVRCYQCHPFGLAFERNIHHNKPFGLQ